MTEKKQPEKATSEPEWLGIAYQVRLKLVKRLQKLSSFYPGNVMEQFDEAVVDVMIEKEKGEPK
jgi:hypothetical protein